MGETLPWLFPERRRVCATQREGQADPPPGGRWLPLGVLEVDAARCTLCGLCALPCLTEALHFTAQAGQATLAFDHAGCAACALWPKDPRAGNESVVTLPARESGAQESEGKGQ